MNTDDCHRELGRVTKVIFGIEDHGILTLNLIFDFGGTAQSTGGYCCSWGPQGESRPRGTVAGADLVCAMLHFWKVRSLDEIKGQVAYVLRGTPGGSILGLERTAFDGGEKFIWKDWQADVERWEKRLLEEQEKEP